MSDIDVFLSHNSKDKPAVRDLKRRLVEAGLKVWYDEEELRPGISYQKLLEAGITNSKSIAVLVGKDGLGPWEDEEMQAAMILGVNDNRPVIPVLLPGDQAQPSEVPLFLRSRTWVDLRGGYTKQGIDLLVWGITDKKPGGQEKAFNFVLQIGERQGDSYPVQVLQSPAGAGTHVMKLPFEDLERKLILKTLEVARLRSSGTTRLASAGPEASSEIQDFGRRLFESLLGGDVYRSYDDARREASECDKDLRLQLSIQAPDLATLPWEYLYDTNRREYLALSQGTPLVRYLRSNDPRAPSIPPCAAERIRILGMLSSPIGMPPLDLVKERERIEKSLAKLREQGAVELVWVRGNTIEELNSFINNNGPWHVFHFVGHGRFDSVRDEGCIVIQDERGAPRDFLASKLGIMLHDHRSLRLVVLNACETGAGNETDVFSSTAASLVQRGIPAVLAMQYPISDGAASIFAARFYESLAKGSPVDIALTVGRKAIDLECEDSVEWGTPVLFTSSMDGQLFVDNSQVSPLHCVVTTSPTVMDPLTTLDDACEQLVVVTPSVKSEDLLIQANRKQRLFKDVRFWKTPVLRVLILVACENAQCEGPFARLRAVLKHPLPVFDSFSHLDQFHTNQAFQFEWRQVTPDAVLAELNQFQQQDETRLAVVVSDLLARKVAATYEPTELARSISTQFCGWPHQVGMLALTDGSGHRITEIDRTLSIENVDDAKLRNCITKVADGLRLKSPPGKREPFGEAEWVQVRLAQTEQEIEDCLRLRFHVYECMSYLDEQLSESPAQIELDIYDKDSLHFLAQTNDGQIIGAVRVIPAQPLINRFPNECWQQLAVRKQNQLLLQVAQNQVTRGHGNMFVQRVKAGRGLCALPIMQATQFQGDAGGLHPSLASILDNRTQVFELSRLVVAPQYRGDGISPLLIRAAFATVLDLKSSLKPQEAFTPLVMLECVPAHVGMYQRYGFECIPGTHSRNQALDEEAVAMSLRLDFDDVLSRAVGAAKRDLKAMRELFGNPDQAMLFGAKHLCMCRRSECWSNGEYNLARKSCCPLLSLHEPIGIRAAVRG